MGTIIIKEAPEVDFYVGWSSVVEAPVYAGGRAEILVRLASETDPYLRDDAPHHPERRMARADQFGTSSTWVHSELGVDYGPEQGSWEDVKGEIFMQRGVCPRANIFTLARRLLADGDADVADLLIPFEYETEVRS